MKYAAAMRYGGELVGAEDVGIDYQSYKHLGLLCPECKEPVFLRAEGTRTVKDKEIKIGAHFCHFKTKDAELAKICENRIGGYTKEDIERRSDTSKGQRLKLMQRHLWKLLTNPANSHTRFKEGRKIQLEAMTSVKSDPYLAKISDLFDRMLLVEKGREGLKGCLNNFLGNVKDYAERAKEDSNCPDFMREAFIKTSGLELRMQKTIAHEVIDFICSKGASGLRLDLITLNLVPYICSHKQLASVEQDLKQMVPFIFRAIALTIATTHWAEEFGRLEKESTNSIDSQPQNNFTSRKTRSPHSGKGFAATKNK